MYANGSCNRIALPNLINPWCCWNFCLISQHNTFHPLLWFLQHECACRSIKKYKKYWVVVFSSLSDLKPTTQTLKGRHGRRSSSRLELELEPLHHNTSVFTTWTHHLPTHPPMYLPPHPPMYPPPPTHTHPYKEELFLEWRNFTKF